MTRVVGRERELLLAAEFLDLAGERFTALVIEGDAGIGKTTVWRETVRSAEERGFVVLRCRPAEKEAKLGLSAVADLLEPLPTPALAVLPEPQRRALDVALLRADPGNTMADQRTVATAVRSLLKSLASEAPVLVAVDDVHWLDPASASTLEFALRRLAGERVGFLASRRGSEPALRVEDLVEPDALKRARLGPLSLAGIHHLLKERLASPPSRSVLVRVHAASGGNPLFALEVGRLLDEVGVPAAGEPLPIPSDVRALVKRRVGKLPSATREVLLAAAALDDPREETVRSALGRPIGSDFEPALRAQVAECERGLITFAHPLFAAAILASATAVERRGTHRRLADAVEGSERMARHLALSVDCRDEATAKVVDAAARSALLRGAPVAAAELVELALRLGERDSEAERRRTIDLADYLFAAGERERARAVLEQISSWEGWSPSLQARAVGRLCALVSEAEHPAAAIEFLESMLVQPLGAEARAAVYSVLSYTTSEVDASSAAKHSETALALLEPLGENVDPSIHASALYMRLRAHVLLGRGLDRAVVDRIRHIEERLPPERRSVDRVSPGIAYWLRHVDELPASRAWLERNLRDAAESGFEAGELNSLVHLAITECWAGDFARAHRHALSAVDLAGDLKVRFSALLADEALALVEAHLGNVDAVREIVARQAHPSSPRRHGTLLFRAALGLIELSLGDNAAADVQFRAGLDAADEVGCREPGIHRMHANAAEAAVGLGDLERAKQIGDFLEDHGGSAPATAGVSRPAHASERSSWRPTAISRVRWRPRTGRSSDTSRFRCRSSGHGRCWSRASSSGARGSAGKRRRRSRRRSQPSSRSARVCGPSAPEVSWSDSASGAGPATASRRASAASPSSPPRGSPTARSRPRCSSALRRSRRICLERISSSASVLERSWRLGSPSSHKRRETPDVTPGPLL